MRKGVWCLSLYLQNLYISLNLHRLSLLWPGVIKQHKNQPLICMLPHHLPFNKCDFVLQIHVSRKWGFTKWGLDVYEEMRAKGTLVPDGTNVQYKPDKGPLQAWKNAQSA